MTTPTIPIRHRPARAVQATLAVLALAAAVALAAPEADADVQRTEKVTFRVETFAGGLENPWGLAFLPGGGALVTEKDGRLRHVSPDGRVSAAIAGVPQVDARRQGGLLDVVADPDFADNRLVYLSYSEREGDVTGTAVARARLSDDLSRLENPEVIFRRLPKIDSPMHFGSRLVFDGDGHLFVTLGEGSAERFRGQAQDLDSHLGKVVRIRPDGSVPEDNPFVGREGALPEIWSYGHRNPQAAAMHPETGELWEVEHGPRGGDEVNVARAGENYGWPVVSHGVNYSGTPIGTGQSRMEGMVDPLHVWVPSIAPSGMAFYGGEAFPEWQGDLFVGALAGQALQRLELDGDRVVGEERLLGDLGHRIRDVREGPEGALYLLVDSNRGAILRLSPAGQARTD